MLYAPSLKLMQSYSDTDIRRCWFATDQSLLPDNYADQLIKYRGRAEALNLNDLKMMRTGEFYLIRAEAFLQSGQSVQALADLNTLRLARDPEAEVLSVSAKDQIQEMITHEHVKELPFEGDRYFNLKRLNKSIERNAADVDENQNLLSSDDPHYFIPIPQSEIMTKPNIRPNNPGW